MGTSEDHTYFIGNTHWGFSLWVHNTYKPKQAANGKWNVEGPDGPAQETIYQLDGTSKNVVKEFDTEAAAKKYADELNTNAPRGVRGIPDGFTDRVGKIASDLGRSEKEVREAIHKVKWDMPRGGPVRNPDVVVNPKTGEVHPKTPDGSIGDSIGNIFDFLD